MIGPLNSYDDIYSRMSPTLKAIYFLSSQKSSGIDVDLSHIHRAIEQSIFFLEGEKGAKLTYGMKNSGQLEGVLSDYYHYHIPQSTKSAIRFNAKKTIEKALSGLKDENGNAQLSPRDIKRVFANVASGFQGYDYIPPKKELSQDELEQIARNEKIDTSLEASDLLGTG